ncbi:MAG TPA: hydantoinase B/oxoprolinase family protein [Solirubrobacteraceae bacterium]|nr:hydantoinase B/oxoprolinase family protein [Solirubrobacteraceae bacterium]
MRERDGVRLAVLSSRIDGIVRKMTNTLFRTARSGVINTAHDFSCCILTGRDELVSAAECLPIMAVCGPEMITAYVRQMHSEPRRGDAFLHNSPYHGNSHAADHCIVVPVVDDLGAHRFTVLVKAHVADCGNSIPSSLMAAARDVYHEGALIFPAVQIQRDGRDIDDVLRMCRTRIRAPALWEGDLHAMLGAARIGERELELLAGEIGWEVIEAFAADWLAYSDERMAAAIARLPAGRASAETIHDAMPGLTDELRVRATVDVRPAEGIVEVDLRDNPDCVPCGMNLTESTARACGLIGVLNAIPDRVPLNAGSLGRIHVLLREGCAIGIPRPPASCSLATTHLTIRAINVVQRAIAELADGVGMAETGADIPASGAALSGADPRRGHEPFVGLVFLGISAGAASPFADGWIGAEANTAGMMYNDSVEIDELHYPFRVWSNRIVQDSAGAGRRRGAPSLHVEYEPVGVQVTAIWITDGTAHPAAGVRGGGAGACARQYRVMQDGTLEELPGIGAAVLAPGQRLVSYSTAGGGYGPPHEREPERVARDVREGWVSTRLAHEVYAVVLGAAGDVDTAATATLRRALAGRCSRP